MVKFERDIEGNVRIFISRRALMLVDQDILRALEIDLNFLATAGIDFEREVV